MAKQSTKKTIGPSSDAGKWKAVESALDQIRDKFGDGSIMKLSDSKALNVASIPTGSISLDAALGIGGIPKGRVVEI